MSMVIKKHNKKITNNKATPTTPPCNCRKKTECPLNGNCQQPSVIYPIMAKIKNRPEKVYLGLTEGPRKQINYRHKFSLSNKKYAHSTALSKYVWDCKDKIKQTPEISWKNRQICTCIHQHLKKMRDLPGGKDGHDHLSRPRETLR